MSQKITFYKYHGTGNDFVMIDNRDNIFPKSKDLVSGLCHRRFGVGADGLILLENDAASDFRMVYYNADGNESTMCGNGGRCIVAFAHFLHIFADRCAFNAVDGLHEASVSKGLINLKMIEVPAISHYNGYSVLNTGSPHYVKFTDRLEDMDVAAAGRAIRYSAEFAVEGINVNFAEKTGDNSLFVRTYERGVEDETYSCGTGVTAAALVTMHGSGSESISVKTLGGELTVCAKRSGEGFSEIWLEGPAVQVFKGETELQF